MVFTLCMNLVPYWYQVAYCTEIITLRFHTHKAEAPYYVLNLCRFLSSRVRMSVFVSYAWLLYI
jgi:hypothetical protein